MIFPNVQAALGGESRTLRTMKVELTPENAAALTKYAALAGHTPAEFLRDVDHILVQQIDRSGAVVGRPGLCECCRKVIDFIYNLMPPGNADRLRELEWRAGIEHSRLVDGSDGNRIP